MRYGVLSDIHANLHALDAALAHLQRVGVDAYLCGGDLVGYGPHPNECVERIAGLNATVVAGNHDLIALGRLPDDQCIRLARESLRWTRGVLRPDARAYLEALPLRADVEAGTVALAHGSLNDPRRYITQPEQAREQLAELQREAPGARLLLLAHTHRPMACSLETGAPPSPGEPLSLPGGPWVLNPGSVGQSRDRTALARFLVLDTEAATATFFAIPYDEEGCRRALRAQGLPADSMHLRPSPLRTCVGGARRLARRALALARGSSRSS